MLLREVGAREFDRQKARCYRVQARELGRSSLQHLVLPVHEHWAVLDQLQSWFLGLH